MKTEKKLTKKVILKEIFGGLILLGVLCTGGYFVYGLANSSKEKAEYRQDLVFSESYTLCDSLEVIKKICPECTTIDYEKFSEKLDKYIKKNNLEKSLK